MKRLFALVGALALLTTGCGVTSASVSSSRSSAAPVVRPVEALAKPCKASDEPPQDSPNLNSDGRLTAAFVPVDAYLCYDEQRTYPGDGIWQVLVGQRLVGDLGPLGKALEQPDTAAPTPKAGVTYACAGSLAITPTLILVSATGQQLRPRAPLDWCGDQLPNLGKTIAGLRAVNVQVTKLRQLQSQAQVNNAAKATALGCQPEWKDPFSHGMVPASLSLGGPLTPSPATVVLCLYRPTPAGALGAVFVAGRHLDAAQTRQLLHAVTLPGKPGGCSKPHQGVLVVTRGIAVTAQIEVGGCSRVIRPAGERDSVGRVIPTVVATLTPR